MGQVCIAVKCLHSVVKQYSIQGRHNTKYTIRFDVLDFSLRLQYTYDRLLLFILLRFQHLGDQRAEGNGIEWRNAMLDKIVKKTVHYIELRLVLCSRWVSRHKMPVQVLKNHLHYFQCKVKFTRMSILIRNLYRQQVQCRPLRNVSTLEESGCTAKRKSQLQLSPRVAHGVTALNSRISTVKMA